MPTLTIPDGEIHYEVHGAGYPLMIFAPGGLRSELAFWRHSPSNPSAPAVGMDPMVELGKKYRVVAMDQRNAGRSRTRVDAGDDWHVCAGDHLALADILGIERFHVMGGRIAASFCLTLCELAPRPDQRGGVAAPDRPRRQSHPKVIGEEIAELAPKVEVLRQWKGVEHLQTAIERVTKFAPHPALRMRQ
jgi:pimeloyl-ACP methyl ester carboxylesterase